jgi:hypothetical protein
MSRENGGKLNRLLAHWPTQAIFACSWLFEEGFGYDLLAKYRNSGWLKPIGHGAVARAGDRVDWTGGLYALQIQLKLPIYVGGKSALLLKGLAHFIPKAKGWELTLYAPPKTKLPAWFRNHSWEPKVRLVTSNLFETGLNAGFSAQDQGAFSIQISSPERAILEFLMLVPQEESFEEAKLLMEGLTTLRPKLVQQLLEACQSVKVKRLFLFLAEECNPPWMKKIDVTRVNLGRGKRVIQIGGVFNMKYGITVPKGSM